MFLAIVLPPASAVGASAAERETTPLDESTAAQTGVGAHEITGSCSAKSSSPSRLRGEGELIGFLATPFEGKHGAMGFGWGLAMGIGWKRWPLTAGFDFLNAYFDTATSRVSIPLGNTTLQGRETRDYTGWFFDAFLRIQPSLGSVRPYIEGVVGTKLLQTLYTLELDSSASATESARERQWAYTLGAGVGIDLPIFGAGICLTVASRRLAGGRASYSRPSTTDSNPMSHYYTKTSTNLYAIGVASCASEQ